MKDGFNQIIYVARGRFIESENKWVEKSATKYALAVMIQLDKNKTCKLVARGTAISKAVDILELLKKEYHIITNSIITGTQKLQDSSKSFIEIEVQKDEQETNNK